MIFQVPVGSEIAADLLPVFVCLSNLRYETLAVATEAESRQDQDFSNGGGGKRLSVRAATSAGRRLS